MRDLINTIQQLTEAEIHRLAPDVGAVFKIVGQNYDESSVYYNKHTYRLNSWMKKAPPPKPKPDIENGNPSMRDILDHILDSGNREFEVGNEKTRLMWCTREEAEFVCGSGVSGTIQPLDRIEVIGRVNWSEEQIEELRRNALRKVGEILF